MAVDDALSCSDLKLGIDPGLCSPTARQSKLSNFWILAVDSTQARPAASDARPVRAFGIVAPERAPFILVRQGCSTSPAITRLIAMSQPSAQAYAALERELAEAHAYQAAVEDVLRRIGDSPHDPQPVFDAILERAIRLCQAKFGVAMRFDGELLHLQSAQGLCAEDLLSLRARFPMRPAHNTLSGRSVLDRAVVQSADFVADTDWDLAHKTSRLVVPLVRGDCALGAMVVGREAPGGFPASQVSLLQTFADQAVIAIENVRRFNETREALQHQTATAEILKVIGSSPTNVQPVFDAIAERARLLCGASAGLVVRVEGNQMDMVSLQGPSTTVLEEMWSQFPLPVNRASANGRAILERAPVNIPNYFDDPEIAPALKAAARRGGVVAHGGLSVPMLHGDDVIGTIYVVRDEPGLFSDKLVHLLETFADQAVIAIENVRLFNETREALERQTATAEILKVMGSSPTGVQPVFDVIVEQAMTLCGASLGFATLADEKYMYLQTARGLNPADETVFRQAGAPRDIDRKTVQGRAILEGRPVQVADVQQDAEYGFKDNVGIYRSMLAVPLLQKGCCVGGLAVGRPQAGLFSAELVDLLQTFAAQAVIAIENVRLFNETKEALERQTATAEVLRAISTSIEDTAPVFERILDGCEHLFGADQIGIAVLDENDLLQLAAVRGPHQEIVRAMYPIPVEQTVVARVLRDGQVAHFPEVVSPEGLPPMMQLMHARMGNFTTAVAPMLRDVRRIGALWILRSPPRPFTPTEMQQLVSFTDQAVIAIENARLFRETREALERQTAMSEILRVISESPTDLQPVFDAIVERAMALCGAAQGAATRFDGEMLHVACMKGVSEDDMNATRAAYPARPGPGTMMGRAALERRPAQIPDFQSDPEYQIKFSADARSGLAVPLLRDGHVMGTLAVLRKETGFFPEQQVKLLQTFADQAVIAIENVRLFNETREALAQQTAISDILRVTTESPSDVQPVLDAIGDHAVRLCDAASASIFLIEAAQLRHVTSRGPLAEQTLSLEPIPIDRSSTTGRAILERRTVHVEDMQAEGDEYPLSYEFSRRFDYRTILAAPLFREGKPFGAILLLRQAVRPFSEREIGLLRTFGDQAAIALENVRLFKETEEALEQQTATAEILRVISSSMADTQPVFDKIVESCSHLLAAELIAIFLLRDDRQMDLGGTTGGWGERLKTEFGFPAPLPGSIHERALVTGKAVHYPRVSKVTDRPRDVQQMYETVGDHSVVAVPMMWEGRGIGTLCVGHLPPQAFSDREIALLTTFADQAVIAIENARLFHEIEDKSRQLEAANQHKSEFLANMSHELRTPLNAIIGFSEVMLERMFGELNDKQEDYLKDIHSSGEHLLSLINDILDLSKIEAGRMELDVEEFDVAAALGNALTLIRERAQRHGIALSLDADEALGTVRADQRKFKQIMLNLLSNAVKFTPEGGQITVRATRAASALEVAVIDTGIGIDVADQGSVFEEFRQVGGDYTNKQEGTGLGLALTRRFVELHGGTIDVTSAPGQGSTFTFTLPRQP